MSFHDPLLIVALLFGFYAAWNIGANDVSNAMGTSVGSKALTLKQACFIAAIFEFSGAVLFGSHVSETLQKGIINPAYFELCPQELLYGMLAALLATGIWLQLATYFGLPVSTTHSIVGALVGFGAVIGSKEAVYWDKVSYIACSWIVSPLLGAFFSYMIFSLLRKHIFYKPRPLEATKKTLPWVVTLCVFVLSIFVLYETKRFHEQFFIKLLIVIILSALIGFISHILLSRFQVPFCPVPEKTQVSAENPILISELEKARKHLLRMQGASQGEVHFRVGDILEEVDSVRYNLKHSLHHETRGTDFYWVEKFFGYLQIFSACLMAFSHGANDVANAIGPLAAIISIIQTQTVHFQSTFPISILILGGIGIVVGLYTWGWRVIDTIGKKITELTPSRGFSAEFGAAITILAASGLGFPISTTHTLVGSVLGVGFAGGIGTLNLRMVRDIIISWMITIPAGALCSIICYYIISSIFN